MESTQFEWSDSFKLGFGPIDQTHEEFVNLTQILLSCHDSALKETLIQMRVHMEDHFGEENEWMDATDFPARECHKDEHAAVMKSLLEVTEEVSKGNMEVARRFAQALADWFPGHADYLDSALAQWMVKRQTGGVPVVFKRSFAWGI